MARSRGQSHVGRETVEGRWGPVLDGIKITVFDVSNPSDPAPADFTVIGDHATHSNVWSDHKAALGIACGDIHARHA